MPQHLNLYLDPQALRLPPETYEQSLLQQLSILSEQSSLSIHIDYLSSQTTPHAHVFWNFIQQHLPKLANSCTELSIDYQNTPDASPIDQDILNAIFLNFEHFSALQKLSLNFTLNPQVEMPFQLLDILSHHLLSLPNPSTIKDLCISAPNLSIGLSGTYAQWMISDIQTSECELLQFINSCQDLTHFTICGNNISPYFQDKLNTCLKNLPKLENVTLEYSATSENFKPISEILKNPSITHFSFSCANLNWDSHPFDGSINLNESCYIRPFEIPVTQLIDAQKTLLSNRTLRHLSLDFTDAFDDSNLTQNFVQHDSHQFITHHLFKFFKTIMSMYHLQNLNLKLPNHLNTYLNLPSFRTDLLNCFQYPKGVENIDIHFSALQKELSKIMAINHLRFTRKHQIMKAHFGHNCLFHESQYTHESLLIHQFPSISFQDMTEIQTIHYDIQLCYYLSSYLIAPNPSLEALNVSKNELNLLTHFSTGLIERLLWNVLDYARRCRFPSAFFLSYLTAAEILNLTICMGGVLRAEKWNDTDTITASPTASKGIRCFI